MVRNLTVVTTAPARTAAPSVTTTVKNESKQTQVVNAGNVTPANGNDLPAAKPAKPVERIDISKAIEQLTRLAKNTARDLQFSVDEVSGRTVITVINASTDEVVRQIPSEEVLALARNLEGFGTLIDAEA